MHKENPLFTFVASNTLAYPNNSLGYDKQPMKNYMYSTLPQQYPVYGKTTSFNEPPQYPTLVHSYLVEDSTGTKAWRNIYLRASEAYQYVRSIEGWIPSEITRRLNNYIAKYNADVDARNKVKTDKYASDVKKYQEALTKYNQAVAKYNSDLATFDDRTAAYPGLVAVYLSRMEEYELEYEDYKLHKCDIPPPTPPTPPVAPVRPTTPIVPPQPSVAKPIYPTLEEHFTGETYGLRRGFYNAIRSELGISAITPYGYSLNPSTYV